jgi:hypothetical protein
VHVHCVVCGKLVRVVVKGPEYPELVIVDVDVDVGEVGSVVRQAGLPNESDPQVKSGPVVVTVDVGVDEVELSNVKSGPGRGVVVIVDVEGGEVGSVIRQAGLPEESNPHVESGPAWIIGKA